MRMERLWVGGRDERRKGLAGEESKRERDQRDVQDTGE